MGKGERRKEKAVHCGNYGPAGFTGPKTRRYDAAVIIDADNLVALNFLQVMNNRLQEGEKLIQCFIDSKTQ